MTLQDAITQAGVRQITLYEIVTLLQKFPQEPELEAVIAIAITQKMKELSTEELELLPSLMETLSNSTDMSVRWAVARNLYTPLPIIEKLANDPINLVRALVATNPNTPTELLQKFFSDEKIVRDGLSGNTATPPKLLKVLADDSDVMVRLRIATNPSTPLDSLKKLIGDSEEKVIIAAQKSLQERV